jgi:two-component system response regulator PilR (NtrC family)
MAIVLVVDDEEALLKIVVRFLTGLGHKVISASNGTDALTMLESGGADLLITDMNLPEMDGIQILRTMSGRGIKMPVIAMSGGGAFDKSLLLGSAGLLGAVETLEKPFELDELRLAVERVLASTSPRRSTSAG